MKRNVVAKGLGERVVVVGWEAQAIKVLQAEQRESQLTVRHLTVREVAEGDVAAAGEILREMVTGLDRPLGRVLLIVPRSEVLTRYAKLPSRHPDELLHMATYQMHGELPFPVEECVVAIHPLDSDDQGTRVFLAAVHRPVIDRLLAVARSAGLVPEGIAISTEGAASWAGQLWAGLQHPAPGCWLFAAVSGDIVELGIVADQQLVFMRQGAMLGEVTPERLGLLIRETVSAYTRELRGAMPNAVLVIGAFSDPGAWETRLHERVDWPVSVVSPTTAQLWDASVAPTAMELLHEIELVDLLGVATRPRHLALDLLPVEVKRERLQIQRRQAWWMLGVWGAIAVGWLAVCAAVGVGRQWWQVRRLEHRVAELEPQANAVQSRLHQIEQGLAARRHTAAALMVLTHAAGQMPPGVTWSTVTLDADGRLLLKGVAPSYEVLFQTLAALARLADVRDAVLQSATERLPGQVEFELAVRGVLP